MQPWSDLPSQPSACPVCREVTLRRAEKGDIIQMVSLEIAGSDRITGMLVPRRLMQSLPAVLQLYQNQIKADLAARGIRQVAQMPAAGAHGASAAQQLAHGTPHRPRRR